jgi:hypothetical protein
VLLSAHVFAELAAHRAEVAVNLAEQVCVPALLGESKRLQTTLTRRRKVTAGELHLPAVHLDENTRLHIAEDRSDFRSLVERSSGLLPPFELGVQLSRVVQARAGLLGGAESPEFGKTRRVELKRAFDVAAHVRNDSQILRRERGEAIVAGAQCRLSRLLV